MITLLIRTFILFFLAIFSVRMMGKRQIGEMQPTELVVTILLSEIAAAPMQDTDLPLINSVLSVLLLVGLSIITSVLSMRYGKFREAFDGHPAIVINNGKVDQKKMRDLRLTVQDLMSSLRQKGVFELSQVEYAIVETNGTVSVMLKPEFNPLTAGQAGKKAPDEGLPHLVICDGKILSKALPKAGLSEALLKKHLKSIGKAENEIMILTYGKQGFSKAIEKEDKQ
ncbi:MAG: DUF421 domain-containing protein [Clostridia bacterium]|nr:DUF421 domain-containing protein [Clostridia bacterium]